MSHNHHTVKYFDEREFERPHHHQHPAHPQHHQHQTSHQPSHHHHHNQQQQPHHHQQQPLNHHNNHHRSNSTQASPTRDYVNYMGPLESEVLLRLKWLDNSPRMSRLRDHRQKRLNNKLEQFELWDIEQSQKNRQYEVAREQRYKNIVDRLKSQEFCVNLMKKRHESDLETTRELETYTSDHLYVDALDDPKTNYKGPISQYRSFQAEMDGKLKHLQSDLESLNPRHRIEQAIMPRLERTRELYSMEPDVYTHKGKRVLKKPNLRNKISVERGFPTDSQAVKFYYPTSSDNSKLKPILHGYQDESVKSLSKLKISNNAKAVNFNESVDYNQTKDAAAE